jgi:hypothetical protein
MGPVDLEEGSQPGVQSGWGLDLEDIVCEYSLGRSL